MRHLRETGQEVVIVHTEAGNAIKRIGNDIDATGKRAEQQPNVVYVIAKACANLAFGIRM